MDSDTKLPLNAGTTTEIFIALIIALGLTNPGEMLQA
jgi:hypothetical protein